MASADSHATPLAARRRSSGSAPRSTGVLAVQGRESKEPPAGTLSREHVGDLQRARILAAITELVHERGVGGVTVAHVVARSGVSRRTFYELFEDREGCLLAAFEHAVRRAAAVVLPIYEANAGQAWAEQVRAGLGALLVFLDDDYATAGLLIVDSLAGEQRMLASRARILDTLVGAVHRGARAHALAAACETNGRGVAGVTSRKSRAKGRVDRGEHAAVRPGKKGASARIIAEGAVGAVLAVLHRRLLERDKRPLGGLLNPLMAMLVLPYLGPDAAERELAQPTPRTRRRAPLAANPLRELDMRLTYRTVRVLLAISELGRQGTDPNGRQVADASGISDQGQISKLLARLQHLGLIHNSASSRGKGEPNAWTLTASGREVEQAVRAQTAS